MNVTYTEWHHQPVNPQQLVFTKFHGCSFQVKAIRSFYHVTWPTTTYTCTWLHVHVVRSFRFVPNTHTHSSLMLAYDTVTYHTRAHTSGGKGRSCSKRRRGNYDRKCIRQTCRPETRTYRSSLEWLWQSHSGLWSWRSQSLSSYWFACRVWPWHAGRSGSD